MPIYSYKCNSCNNKKEEWYPSFEDSEESKQCKDCGSVSVRVIDCGQALFEHAKKFTGKLRPKKALMDGKIVDLTK